MITIIVAADQDLLIGKKGTKNGKGNGISSIA